MVNEAVVSAERVSQVVQHLPHERGTAKTEQFTRCGQSCSRSREGVAGREGRCWYRIAKSEKFY